MTKFLTRFFLFPGFTADVHFSISTGNKHDDLSDFKQGDGVEKMNTVSSPSLAS